MQALGLDSIGLQVEYFLTRAADAATLDVCVKPASSATCNPVAQTSEGAANGYFYDAGSNSVVFNPGSVPGQGAEVRIHYGTFCY